MMCSGSGDESLDIVLGPVEEVPLAVEAVRPKGIPIGRTAPGTVEVFIEPPVALEVIRHTSSDTRVELGGLLLGQVLDDSGPFVRVNCSLEARHTATSLGSLRFTHATWADFAERVGRECPGLKVVGWYHSHPGHGVFVSSMDRFIHQHFFPNPWQCAWVIDPVRKHEGMFQWVGGQIRQSGYTLIQSGESAAPGYCTAATGHVEVAVPEEDDFKPIPDELVSETTTLLSRLGSFFDTYCQTGARSLRWTELGRRFSGSA